MRYYPFNNVKIMLPSLITVMAQMIDCDDDDDDDVGCRKIVYRVGVPEMLGFAGGTFRKKKK
jgi:hypothetical protein